MPLTDIISNSEQKRSCYRQDFLFIARLLYAGTVLFTLDIALKASTAYAQQNEPAKSLEKPELSSKPIINAEIPKKHKRPIAEERLEALFNTESLSYLLNHNNTALRRQDISAGYFVAEQAFGNLAPGLKPWRDRLSEHGFTFELTYKGEGMANLAGGLSKGMDYTHEIRASMLFDLGKLTGWNPLQGWYLHGIVMNREGRQVGWDHVGERNVLLLWLPSVMQEFSDPY